MTPPPPKRTGLFWYPALALLALVSLSRVCDAGFIEDFDDGDYVTNNPHVQGGLTVSGVSWAVGAFHSNNWHPLTWISLQLDTELFGTGPGGYHTTNLLLHTATVLLLFRALTTLTGDRQRSAAVAALFAVHPLHVESVAWVAERKDVLSGLFWMLGLLAYERYTRRPGPGRYALVVLVVALGLTAKPMFVTFPCVLLLLDYWPLRRVGPGGAAPARRAAGPWRLAAEKAPLLALAALCSAATVAAQQGIVQTRDDFPLAARATNALASYVGYLVQTVWPARLAFFYPHPAGDVPVRDTVRNAAVLVGITAAVVCQARRRPYLLVGWLWYLGTLVPVIGLVQVGLQAHADRYTYIPHIGLFVMAAWGVPELLSRLGMRPAGVAAVAAGVIGGCAIATWVQAGYWRDSPTLWQHTLEATGENYMASQHLGTHALKRGDLAAARGHFTAALRQKTNIAAIHLGLGEVNLRQGQLQEATRCFEAALEQNPALAVARFRLGEIATREGNPAEAVRQYRLSLELNPDQPEAHNNLGAAYTQLGRFAEAAEEYRDAVRARPDMVSARLNLTAAYTRLGRFEEAAAECENARLVLESTPRDGTNARRLDALHTAATHLLAQIRHRQGRTADARALFQRVVDLAPQNPRFRCDLAHLLHETGNAAAARQQYEEAYRLDPHWAETANRAARELAASAQPASRDPVTALELARQVNEATGGRRPEYLDTLAVALAAGGRFDEAIDASKRALSGIPGPSAFADEVRERIRTYEARTPWRDPKTGGKGP